MKTVESGMLKKVRAILDKAEATDNENERDTFLAKAQELMERYAISQAQLELAKQSPEREPVEEWVAWPSRSVGKSAKGSLAITIAKANRCQVTSEWRMHGDKRVLGLMFQGMPEDVELCVMLYTSLCLQAEQAYNPRNKPEWTNGRTYRASFFEGYASRVRNRIDEQARERKAKLEADASGTALVLVGVQKRVEAKFGRARYGSRRVSNSCAAGRNDGARAGASADLSGGRTRQMANRKALTS